MSLRESRTLDTNPATWRVSLEMVAIAPMQAVANDTGSMSSPRESLQQQAIKKRSRLRKDYCKVGQR
jgi:hypothetical protein